ncbi:MAG: hypothetical protein AAGC55_17185, partial [Myxococcota bacterium]
QSMRLSILILLGACGGVAPSSTDDPAEDTTAPPPQFDAPAPMEGGGAELPHRILGEDGFWCYTRSPAEGPDITPCFRRQQVCVTQRAKALETMDGTECEAAPRAHCFFMTSVTLQSMAWRCFGSGGDCDHERGEFKKRMSEHFEFGQCAISAELDRDTAPSARN